MCVHPPPTHPPIHTYIHICTHTPMHHSLTGRESLLEHAVLHLHLVVPRHVHRVHVHVCSQPVGVVVVGVV